MSNSTSKDNPLNTFDSRDNKLPKSHSISQLPVAYKRSTTGQLMTSYQPSNSGRVNRDGSRDSAGLKKQNTMQNQ